MAPKLSSRVSEREARIVNLLREAQRPLGAYELVEQLRDQGVSAATTVYRALNRLIADGQVHRLESLNAFVTCTGGCQHGTAVFAICEACGAVSEFDDDVIAARLATWAQTSNFCVQRAIIEVSGRCGACTGVPIAAL